MLDRYERRTYDPRGPNSEEVIGELIDDVTGIVLAKITLHTISYSYHVVGGPWPTMTPKLFKKLSGRGYATELQAKNAALRVLRALGR